MKFNNCNHINFIVVSLCQQEHNYNFRAPSVKKVLGTQSQGSLTASSHMQIQKILGACKENIPTVLNNVARFQNRSFSASLKFTCTHKHSLPLYNSEKVLNSNVRTNLFVMFAGLAINYFLCMYKYTYIACRPSQIPRRPVVQGLAAFRFATSCQ